MPAFHLHPEVFLLLGAIWLAYLSAWRRHERDAGPAAVVENRRRKTVLFTAGVVALLAGATWPVHDLAERYLYSVHMVQHLLITLVGAPFLLAGTPSWMARALLRPRAVMRAMRFLTRPIVALAIFNGLLLLTHWPAVVTLSVRSELFHFTAHSALFLSALLMWWPVLSPLPELPALAPPGQMLYLFLQSLAPTVPASFLTFGSSPLYKIYTTFPRVWSISALTDMRVAGLIMKLLGGFILWGVITAVFFRWHADEQRSEGWDALRWRDVEHDVRSEITK